MLRAAILISAACLGLAPAAALAVGAVTTAEASPSASSPLRTQPTDEENFLRVDIDSVTPSSVTTSSASVVTVSGKVVNVGDRPVSDIDVRLQRAPAVGSPEELRTALLPDQQNFDVVGPFKSLSAPVGPTGLKQGASLPFQLALPLRSATTESLEITEPGVYPLLVNVNATPEYGDIARLDDARFLLPVLGLPTAQRPPGGDDPGQPASLPIAPAPSRPVAITMLWPFADVPRLAAGVPGAPGQRVHLIDDELATSLAKGGRLEQLLSTVEFATGPAIDPDKAVTNTLCLAVDPDLMVTVSAMTRGYLVATNPADPVGPAVDGTGADAAAQWLERMRALTGRMCTIATPFAQADIAAVARLDDPSAISTTLSAPAAIVDRILDITSVPGVTWPDSGVLGPAAAATVSDVGSSTAVLATNTVSGSADEELASGSTARIDSAGAGLTAALFDVPAAAALAGMGHTPQTPTFTPQNARYDLTEDSRAARLQDALGALAWPSLTPNPPTEPSRALFLAPPQVWAVDGNESRAVLSMVSTLLRSGLADPRPLATVLREATGTGPTRPVDGKLQLPRQYDRDQVPGSIVDSARNQASILRSLQAAFVNDPQALVSPASYVAPLREDLIRALSTGGRRDSDPAAAELVATQRVEGLRTGIDDIRSRVTLLAPGSTYTQASDRSPLPLVARNDLPLSISVRVTAEPPPGVEVTDIGPQQLPPGGTRQLIISTEVKLSGHFVLDVSLRTEPIHPAGTRAATPQDLGSPIRVSVQSNAYGKATAVFTACAGGLLLILAGRRLWHRFRGQPDPSDAGHVVPEPHHEHEQAPRAPEGSSRP